MFVSLFPCEPPGSPKYRLVAITDEREEGAGHLMHQIFTCAEAETDEGSVITAM